MSVKLRQELERRIANAAIKQLLAAGFSVSINNGGAEDETPHLRSAKKLDAALAQTDEDRLFVWKGGTCVGWVYLVYGNDGWDVISDYTVNLEPFLTEAQTISDHYAD